MITGTWLQIEVCRRFWCRVGCVWLLLAWSSCVSAQATDPSADERKAALIARLLHPRPSPWTPDLQQVLRLMAESHIRRHFKSLSTNADWGPTHAQWRRNFRAFRDDYLEFLAPEARRVEKELEHQLLQTLSDDEIQALIGVVDDPELDQLLRLASRNGLDLDLAVQTASLSASPDLYSAEEIADIRNELGKLRARDVVVMGYIEAKMRALSIRFNGPAFVRYQGIVMKALEPLATATVEDDGFRARFDAWLAGWRRRTGT